MPRAHCCDCMPVCVRQTAFVVIPNKTVAYAGRCVNVFLDSTLIHLYSAAIPFWLESWNLIRIFNKKNRWHVCVHFEWNERNENHIASGGKQTQTVCRSDLRSPIFFWMCRDLCAQGWPNRKRSQPGGPSITTEVWIVGWIVTGIDEAINKNWRWNRRAEQQFLLLVEQTATFSYSRCQRSDMIIFFIIIIVCIYMFHYHSHVTLEFVLFSSFAFVAYARFLFYFSTIFLFDRRPTHCHVRAHSTSLFSVHQRHSQQSEGNRQILKCRMFIQCSKDRSFSVGYVCIVIRKVIEEREEQKKNTEHFSLFPRFKIK